MDADRKPILNLIARPAGPVVACELSADDQAERLREWRTLDDSRTGFSVTPGRLEVNYEVAGEGLARLRRLVEAERHCCAFAEFTVRTDGERVALLITGPPGTEEFFAFLYGNPPGATTADG